MRKFLIIFVIFLMVAVVIALTWLFAGRQVSLYLDRYKTIEARSERVISIRYEGSGTGGTLRMNELGLSLTSPPGGHAPPSIGTTKDGQLALAFEGKVFAFGPLPKIADDAAEVLVTAPQSGDDAVISTRHSLFSWPTFLEFNFMTGQSPTWKRHFYHRLTWKRSS